MSGRAGMFLGDGVVDFALYAWARVLGSWLCFCAFCNASVAECFNGAAFSVVKAERCEKCVRGKAESLLYHFA